MASLTNANLEISAIVKKKEERRKKRSNTGIQCIWALTANLISREGTVTSFKRECHLI